MKLGQIFKDINKFLIVHEEKIKDSDCKKRTWLGHEWRYDQRGCLISHRYQTLGKKIWITYYPGTDERYAKDFVLRRREEDKKSATFVEKWYLFSKELYATVKGNMQDGAMNVSSIRVNYNHSPAPFSYDALNNLRRRFFKDITNPSLSRFDLKKTAQNLSGDLVKLHSNKIIHDKYDVAATNQDTSKQVQKSNELAPSLDTENSSSKNSLNSVSSSNKESTEELKRGLWTDQLLNRMEKYDTLMAQKKKVEASTRMTAERKALRLASLERRIKQNEKAQAILNRKLAILEATKNRDEWKRIKLEERTNYKDMVAEQKAQKAALTNFEGPMQPKEAVSRKEDLKVIAQLKKESYQGYRIASHATKLANNSLRKLKDTKRQNTISELSSITHEKAVLEKAMKTETDLFKYTQMRDRVQELIFQKSALIEEWQTNKNSLLHKYRARKANRSPAVVIQPSLAFGRAGG